MKKIYLLGLSFILLAVVHSQNIIPLRSSEQCPGVNITFTVTLLGQSVQSVQAWALNVNPVVVQQPFNVTSSGGNITFNFIGRFSDYNDKQTFRVFYTNSSGVATTWDATYIKIKSLLTANSFSQIYPTPTSITARRCQVQSFNISFPNVQYGNPWETPPIGYGTVTNYEYLLPSGWSLNGVPSTGGWMASNNNVMVTSDMASGVGGFIRIRPVNTACGSGLRPGQEATVIISRPEPTLTISSNQNTFCSGCETFTINDMPSGATVQWSLSSTDATISGSSTSQTVSVCRNSSANTVVTLTAIVSECAFTYPPVMKNISLGTPSFIGTSYFSGTWSTLSTWNSFGGTGAGHVILDGSLGYTSYNWSLYSGSVQSWTQNNMYPSGLRLDFDLGPYGQYGDQFAFNLSASNTCGTLNETYYFYYTGYYGYRVIVSPNPTSNTIKIEFAKLNKDLTANIQEVQFFDKMGTLKLRKQFGKGLSVVTVSVGHLPSDIYTLRIFDGKTWTSQKIIVRR